MLPRFRKDGAATRDSGLCGVIGKIQTQDRCLAGGDVLLVRVGAYPVFVHPVVGMVPRKEIGIETLPFSEVRAHLPNLFVRKSESTRHVAVEDMGRLEFSDPSEASIISHAFTEQVAIPRTVIINACHCERIAGEEHTDTASLDK